MFAVEFSFSSCVLNKKYNDLTVLVFNLKTGNQGSKKCLDDLCLSKIIQIDVHIIYVTILHY